MLESTTYGEASCDNTGLLNEGASQLRASLMEQLSALSNELHAALAIGRSMLESRSDVVLLSMDDAQIGAIAAYRSLLPQRLWRRRHRKVVERAVNSRTALVQASGLFDSVWYVERYPDVGSSGREALDHFVEYGSLEGRDPGPHFNTNFYLMHNPDVMQRRVEPFLHYIVHGRIERGFGWRAAAVEVAIELYKANVAVVKDELEKFTHRCSDLVAQNSVLKNEFNERGEVIQIQHRQLVEKDQEIALLKSEIRVGGTLRQVADEMERTLLTLALEATPQSVTPVAKWIEPPSPNDALTILLLPDGRQFEIAYAPCDLSVGATLVSSGGIWESHVQNFIAANVDSDWTCLDIGANNGAFTIPLACLASSGQVFAFEPVRTNRARLLRNVAALPGPKANIEVIGVALWDREVELTAGWANELAGCSYVTEANLDAMAVESRFRNVVPTEALVAIELHTNVETVKATTLDIWVEARNLKRLDLIKIDVGGSEIRVLRGAEVILRRFNPTVIIEYNPSSPGLDREIKPDDLYQVLAQIFVDIQVLEPNGNLAPICTWNDLEARLRDGKGREYLVCHSSRVRI